jgi:acetyl esterase/lipase
MHQRKDNRMTKHILEEAAQGIADATSQPPFLYQLSKEEARKVLDDIQAAPIDKPTVDDKWITIPAEVGDVRVRIVKPVGAQGLLPTILYIHGGGWILGNAGTHDRLVRELSVGAEAAVVFVEYDRSPEVQYPVAIEQAYATARWITAHGRDEGLDPSRLDRSFPVEDDLPRRPDSPRPGPLPGLPHCAGVGNTARPRADGRTRETGRPRRPGRR